jgi:hypothetical protein
MAKSKPIGVRFDLGKLDMIQKEQNLTSVQQVVNYLMDNYNAKRANLAYKPINGTLNVSITQNPLNELKNGNPEPPIGLKGIDLTIWKSENWK